MLRLRNLPISAGAQAALATLQGRVDAGADFSARSELAKRCWLGKTGAEAHKAAFLEIRAVLGRMSYGSVRCAYCEDSAADEIEHIAPKTVVPSLTFVWDNYCYACGPCNAPKGNQYATLDQHDMLVEHQLDTLADEPADVAALLDPRTDDYKDFFEIDVGGVLPDNTRLQGTLMFQVRRGLSARDEARAKWTAKVLDLNREVIRAARETAFQSYADSLTVYAGKRAAGDAENELERRKRVIFAMPHPSVLNELIRKADRLPEVSAAIALAPEIAGWIR